MELKTQSNCGFPYDKMFKISCENEVPQIFTIKCGSEIFHQEVGLFRRMKNGNE